MKTVSDSDEAGKLRTSVRKEVPIAWRGQVFALGLRRHGGGEIRLCARSGRIHSSLVCFLRFKKVFALYCL